MILKEENGEAVIDRLKEFLACPTMHPEPRFDEAIDFLRRQAEALGFDFHVSWNGPWPNVVFLSPLQFKNHEKNSDEPEECLLLSSHMDVVFAKKVLQYQENTNC